LICAPLFNPDLARFHLAQPAIVLLSRPGTGVAGFLVGTFVDQYHGPPRQFRNRFHFLLDLAVDRLSRPGGVAHEVLEVLPSDTRLPAYAAIVSVPLHAQQPAQIRVRIGAAVSGLGLETAPVASPNVMQPLTQRMNRLGHQSPPTPQRFFVIISTFLQKTIMIQTHRPFWKCDIVKLD
jgi:hypothetical protein